MDCLSHSISSNIHKCFFILFTNISAGSFSQHLFYNILALVFASWKNNTTGLILLTLSEYSKRHIEEARA